MKILANKHILLGITGGIAAYKSPDIVRRLREQGAKVRVVMTAASIEFITPLTLQAVSGYPVATDLLDPSAEAAMGHIELARWADLILIAPTTANFITVLAHGLANDLLSAICLASAAPKVIAPAMNQQMWANIATQTNLQLLKERGIKMIGPAEGSQACGDIGMGRMLEPMIIVQQLATFFKSELLTGFNVLITAGPTREAIDPVRFLSNHSSGKMGYALAEAALEAGANVTLVSGPVALSAPDRVTLVKVISAQDMYNAVMTHLSECHIFIAAAAVADYRPVLMHTQKIKKSQQNFMLELVRNPDILAAVADSKRKQSLIVGFAAETENVISHAKRKLENKAIDIIVANQVAVTEGGFNSDNNQVTVLWEKGQKEFTLMSKQQLARELIRIFAEHYDKKHSNKNS